MLEFEMLNPKPQTLNPYITPILCLYSLTQVEGWHPIVDCEDFRHGRHKDFVLKCLGIRV